MSERQHGTPIILTDNASTAQRLSKIPYGSPPFQEDRVQQLLAEHPEMIPISEIEPAFNPLVFLGREVPTTKGSLDLLYISPSGYLTLVETKLWENPEARRQVVAQIIDYATGFSQWTFEDLRRAVKKSKTSSGAPGNQDILDIMEGYEGDFTETNFIDSVTRNLARGYFLLLIIGNGIREGVENIMAYLQKTPGLHFSLALVELGLYRLNPDQEYPLYIQPRTVAKTIELVRAVVDINAPPNLEVKVTIPTGRTEGRRKLTEEIFYEELAENTSEKTSSEVRSLVQDLKEMGLISVWGASSVSIRYPDPSESGYKYTVVVLTISGSFYLGWLDRIPNSGGYDKAIAFSYRNCVASLVGARLDDCYGIDSLPVHKLLDQRESFITCVQSLMMNLIRLQEHE